MQFETAKFGQIEIDPECILLLPHGLIGFEQHRHWVLLSDAESDAVGWLQSLRDPQTAFLVATPQRFVPDYRVRVSREEFETLPWSSEDKTIAVAIVNKHADDFTINLKSPVLINLDRCIGRQVVVLDDQPLQHLISAQAPLLRKSA